MTTVITGLIQRGLRSHRARRLVKCVGDIALLSLAYYLSWELRFDGAIPESFRAVMMRYLPLLVFTKVILLVASGSYGAMWRRTGLPDLTALTAVLSLASVFLMTDVFLVVDQVQVRFPRSIILLDWSLSLVLLSAFRILPRALREKSVHLQPWLVSPGETRAIVAKSRAQNVVVYGAGDLGTSILSDIERKFRGSKRIVGIIDDDPALQGSHIRGIEVLGDRSALARLAQRTHIDQIVIAISAISGGRLREIVEHCRQFCPTVQVAPGLDELFLGKVTISDLREVQIEDLLGRESAQVELDELGLRRLLTDKTVLVTGAGGSIGGELCFQILKFAPRKIILLGRGENSIYATKQRLLPHADGIELEELIGDIINAPKMEHVFATRRPHVVFHAAADKHVPLMEANPDEAVLNNIIGTQNVLDAAARHGVEKVVCISSDKAVNPTSVMGCCKRVSELLVRSRVGSPTVSCAVRFGNVLGSRGSVIPLFKKQIADGGPVTITHPDVKRYFMTIPEAVLLVLQAGAIAKGGEVFLLEMGEQIRIESLALEMIRLSGLAENTIKLKYTGLRPGEKLYEELSFPHEIRHRTELVKLYRLEGEPVARAALDGRICALKTMGIEMDFPAIRQTLLELVPEYQPDGEAVPGRTLTFH
jgi:FlaA1/EpsC-like NDP-sugar epimerase